jgi:nitrogen fixation NifU-like protein
VYSEIFLDHFRNPRQVGELEPPALTIQVENPACGDILRLSVLWKNGVIGESRYKVRGCAASIAAGSALTEWLPGRTVSELKTLTAAMIEAAVGGLIPESQHAAVLCVDAVKRLVSVYTQISAAS